MTDVDPALMEKVFDISERKRKPDIHHNCQTNNLRRGFEVAERVRIAHPARLEFTSSQYKRV